MRTEAAAGEFWTRRKLLVRRHIGDEVVGEYEHHDSANVVDVVVALGREDSRAEADFRDRIDETSGYRGDDRVLALTGLQLDLAARGEAGGESAEVGVRALEGLAHLDVGASLNVNDHVLRERGDGGVFGHLVFGLEGIAHTRNLASALLMKSTARDWFTVSVASNSRQRAEA